MIASTIKTGISVNKDGTVSDTASTMQIPNYVVDLMERSKWKIDGVDCIIGYEIRIYKKSDYASIEAHIADVDKLKAWVERNGGEMVIKRTPTSTRHCEQFITAVIYDPIMKYLEPFIGKEFERQQSAREQRKKYADLER